MSVLLLAVLAQLSSPIGDGVCAFVETGIRESALETVEGVGGYCSLSGCIMTGRLAATQVGITSNGGTSAACVYGPNGASSYTTVYGFCFEAGSQSLILRNNSAEQWRFSGATGDLTSAQSRNVSTGGTYTSSSASVVPVFIASGNGGLRLAGVSTASINAATQSSGFQHYDTTVKAPVWSDGTQWATGVTSNLDGGAPFGPSIAFSGHNISTGANLKQLAGIQPRGRYRAESLGWNVETAGSGAGNATAIIRDIGGASNLCTATFLCALTAGSVAIGTCSPWTPASAAGNEIDIRLDCSSCTTCPIMNVTASLGYIPGT